MLKMVQLHCKQGVQQIKVSARYKAGNTVCMGPELYKANNIQKLLKDYATNELQNQRLYKLVCLHAHSLQLEAYMNSV